MVQDLDPATVQVDQDGQLQFADLLMGGDTPFTWEVLTGWEDLPDLDDATALRPAAHGAWPGMLLAGVRSLSFDFTVHPYRWRELDQVLPELRQATALGQVERPLIVQAGGTRRVVWARVVARSLPLNPEFARGYPKGSLEWVCSDPRRYDLTERTATTGLPEAEPGLDWSADESGDLGLEWVQAPGGLDWGTGGARGELAAANDGDADTHPVLQIRGPCTRPRVTHRTSNLVLEYDITLAASDTLTVDTREGTVLLNGAANRLYTASQRSTPEQAFTLAPGANALTFRAESSPGGATVSVRWRNAYW